uniref:hypothetical protein n=1 Tax=Bacillus sp. S1-R2T1-FB TaxID=1973493 RepID=UPI001C4FF22E
IQRRSSAASQLCRSHRNSNKPPPLNVTANATVVQRKSRESRRGREWVRGKQSRVGALDYRHGEGLAIERVELDQPYARVVINEDLTPNVSELIVHDQFADVGGQVLVDHDACIGLIQLDAFDGQAFTVTIVESTHP